MTKRRETPTQRERGEALDDRSAERRLSESYDVPRHVLRSPLAADDDPDFAIYSEPCWGDR